MYLRRNDIVLVIKGKDRLKSGKIIRVDRKLNRVVVEGVNMVKRHVKAREKVPGGILTSERSVSSSNVRLLERPEDATMSAVSLPARVAKKMKKSVAATTTKASATAKHDDAKKKISQKTKPETKVTKATTKK